MKQLGKRGWHVKTLFHDEEWAKVLRRDPCVYCGNRGKGTVEHVDPGGRRSPIVNGVGACEHCNTERGSAPLMIYLLWRQTDRSERFSKWNFRLFSDLIRQRQLQRKLARMHPQPEQRPMPLRVTLAEWSRRRIWIASSTPNPNR